MILWVICWSSSLNIPWKIKKKPWSSFQKNIFLKKFLEKFLKFIILASPKEFLEEFLIFLEEWTFKWLCKRISKYNSEEFFGKISKKKRSKVFLRDVLKKMWVNLNFWLSDLQMKLWRNPWKNIQNNRRINSEKFLNFQHSKQITGWMPEGIREMFFKTVAEKSFGKIYDFF